MASDGVEAEVIYTTLGFLPVLVERCGLQRACFRAYNDWLAEYCSYAPKPLFGLALISLYDIELRWQNCVAATWDSRGHDLGLTAGRPTLQRSCTIPSGPQPSTCACP
jgi:hypothetical protein